MGDTITESDRLSTRLLPVYEHSITPFHPIVKTFTAKRKCRTYGLRYPRYRNEKEPDISSAKKVSTRRTLHAGVNT